MPDLTICTIHCDCEQGSMFKTTIKDEDGLPAMFALVRGENKDFLHYNALVFQGYCCKCGKNFTFSVWLETLLDYKPTN
jgi:hypothetical protein